jgi:hypothetical protein
VADEPAVRVVVQHPGLAGEGPPRRAGDLSLTGAGEEQ